MSVQADLCKVIHAAETKPDRRLDEFMACREPPPEGNAPVKILEPRKMPVGRNLHVPRPRQVGAIFPNRTVFLEYRRGKRFILPLSIERKPLPRGKRGSGQLARLNC